jgi:hypothetical protein
MSVWHYHDAKRLSETKIKLNVFVSGKLSFRFVAGEIMKQAASSQVSYSW